MTNLLVIHIPEIRDKNRITMLKAVSEDQLAETIGAEYFEIYHRLIGKERRKFVIICDEIGRVKGRAPTALRGPIFWTSVFCGDILICSEDSNGNLISLKPEDVSYLERYIVGVEFDGRLVPMLEVEE